VFDVESRPRGKGTVTAPPSALLPPSAANYTALGSPQVPYLGYLPAQPWKTYAYSPYLLPSIVPPWSQSAQLPSSPAKAPLDPQTFPHILKWLQSLNKGPWGADGDYYEQYMAHFTSARYHRIQELIDFKKQDLVLLCDSLMPDGVANRLVQYIQEDVKLIQKRH
jgi:hypothetical protein